MRVFVTISLAVVLVLAAREPGHCQLNRTFDYQLQARSGAGSVAPFNLPPGTSLSSQSPAISDNNGVAIKVLAGSGGAQGVWYGVGGRGGVVYQAGSRFLSDVSLSDFGRIVWQESLDLGVNRGVWAYDIAVGTSGLFTDGPSGASEWGSPQINNHGQVAFRGTVNGGRAHVSYDPTSNTHATHAEQGGDLAFLHTPAFNNRRQIAGKVLLAAGPAPDPNAIYRFDPDGTSALIARDHGSQIGSPYARFFNGIGLNDRGQVTFAANLAGGGQGVFLSDGVATITIADSRASGVGTIEAFAPKVNNRGLVVFRAFDDNGRRAIWAGDGTRLARVVTEGDRLPTDLGPALLRWPGGSAPAFSGNIDVNERGQVVFAASLVSPPDFFIGLGVFVARPTGGPGVDFMPTVH